MNIPYQTIQSDLWDLPWFEVTEPLKWSLNNGPKSSQLELPGPSSRYRQVGHHAGQG